MTAQDDLLITHAQVVLPDQVLSMGTVLVRGGRIADVQPGITHLPQAISLEGDWLLPGLVEVHTDNLERHVTPRPRTHVPMASAVPAHDAEIASAGITTVLDAIGVGDPYEDGFRAQDQSALLGVLDALEAAGALRADHRIHVRCELPAANARELFEPFAWHPRLALMSLMDHTPGQRQWRDLAQARVFYTGRKGWSDDQFDRAVALAPERQARHAQPNRAWFAEVARRQGIALATHDDTSTAHVDEAVALGATMSEFPTTLAATHHAKLCGMATVAGAPNVVRGGSHSGNVSALALARARLLDALSSDYVPSSLLQAAWTLQREAGFTAPEAVALVSAGPARACGLHDRGRIEPGLRADMVRVREVAGRPVATQVWRQGRRVA